MKKKEFRKVFGFRISALIEIIAFFAIVTILAFAFDMRMNFFGISPHPYWIIIILISAQYGVYEGLVSALVAIVLLLMGPVPPRNVLQDYFDYFFFLAKTPMLWVVTAIILGSLRQRHIQERDKLKELAIEAEKKQETVAASYTALKNVKESLETRFASEMQTALMQIRAFNEMESLDKEGIINGACDVTKALVAPETFSLYLIEGEKLQRVAFEGTEKKEKAYKNSFDSDTELYQEVIGKKKVASINISDPEVLKQEGLVAVPILDPNNKEVFGMIKIEEIPFLRLRTTTVESLRTIGEMVGAAYAKHLRKNNKKENKKDES